MQRVQRGYFMLLSRVKGQNVLEYTLLTAAVIAIIVLGSGKFFSKMTGKDGAFTKHFDNMRQRMGVKLQ